METLPIDFWLGTIGLLIAFYIIGRGLLIAVMISFMTTTTVRGVVSTKTRRP